MKLSLRAFSLSCGLIWGAAMLLATLAYYFTGSYGKALLELCSSIYPGFYAEQSWHSVGVGTVYALVDGAIGGCVFAWLYNKVSG